MLTNLQLNISSRVRPSIDVSSLEDEYESGNGRSFMKNNSSGSSKYQLLNDTLKVRFWPSQHCERHERLPGSTKLTRSFI